MPYAKLREHLDQVTDRLEQITISLLSGEAASHKSLQAERRILLADVVHTCKLLERPLSKTLLRSKQELLSEISLVKTA